MSKYNDALKLKVVEYVIKENHSTIQATKEFNVNNHTIRKWVNKYIKHGPSGLIKNNISYDGNFKINVIKYMHKNHLSLSQTSIYFNLGDHNIVGKWERMYYEEGPQALFEERRGRKNMSLKPNKKNLSKDIEEDLIAENQRLKIENEYLKKLNALVQERIQRENPKKQKPSAN